MQNGSPWRTTAVPQIVQAEDTQHHCFPLVASTRTPFPEQAIPSATWDGRST
jgi:hypothetical protein